MPTLELREFSYLIYPPSTDVEDLFSVEPTLGGSCLPTNRRLFCFRKIQNHLWSLLKLLRTIAAEFVSNQHQSRDKGCNDFLRLKGQKFMDFVQ